MQNNPSVLEKEYEINSLLIDASKQLSLVGLLGMLQDIAGEQATQLGFGYDTLQEQSVYWVLIRQKLKIHRLPQWNNTLRVQTWAQPPTGIYANREFEWFLGEEKVGECSTTWVILDAKTKRPSRIENAEEKYNVRKDYGLDFSANKVKLPTAMTSLKTFEAMYSDIDMNQHVNNIKYSQWILDALPIEKLQNMSIQEYEVNFAGETFLGDQIECRSSFDASENQNEIYFQLNRVEDTKTVFTAKLKVKISS